MNQKNSKWNPAVWLKNTSIRFRLYMVLVVFAIPLLSLAFQVSKARLEEVTQLQNESSGMDHIGPALDILRVITDRRAAIEVCLLGGRTCGQVAEFTAKLDENFQRLEQQDALTGKTYQTAEIFAVMKKQWAVLKAKGSSVTAAENLADSRQIANGARDTMKRILQNSALSLDSDPITFALSDGLVNNLVYVYLDSENLRAGMYRNISKGTSEARDRQKIEDFNHFINRNGQLWEAAADHAIEIDQAGLGKFGQLHQKSKAERAKYQQMLADRFINVDNSGLSVDQFHEISNEYVASYDVLMGASLEYLSKRVQTRTADATRQVIFAIGLVLGSVAVCSLLLFMIVRSITLPLHMTVEKVRVVAGGDLTQRLDINSTDEVGNLAAGMNTLVNNLDSIIYKIYDASSQLTSSSGNLTEASNSLSASTEESSRQSQTIAASATQMNQNLQVVASAIEEMSVSIGEVARKTGEAASIANRANTSSRETNTIVKALGESAKEIGKVIETISGIASQTNLLALNAAIEAAGAGEAGKGFAVVAAEVKELARQSAQASEEIKQKVSAIQASTEQAVIAIDGITNVVGEVSEISTTIASSVEEQSIAAREIAQNVSQSSQASSDVTMNINGISTASKAGAQDAGRAAVLAADLQKISASLSEIVTQFKFTQNGTNGSHGSIMQPSLN